MENRPIQRLSDEVIGQIAAGEVVERPAAAVKELVENSIDAGATAVTVELTDGGLTSIRVSDNGRGIPASQVKMAFERHATSKLTKAEELYDIHTLGFRGEALASIAAVARVTCVSRTATAEYGVKARVEAGEFLEVVEAASPVGTSVTVKDLFYNAPVRLKFLKKPSTEAAFVSDFIMRLILSRPDVAFRFVNQGKTIYRSAGDGTLESALYCVYGKDALRAMRPVKGAEAGVLTEGYVGVGELARGNRLQQSFFINGRYFRDETLSKALESGCEGYVMIGRYPICVLALTMPYRQVDVNVHPNKLEVRFQNPDAVALAVEDLTRRALRTVTIQDALSGREGQQELPVLDEPIQVISLRQEDGTPIHPVPETAEEVNPPLQPQAEDDGERLTPALNEPIAMTRDDSETLLKPPSGLWLTEKTPTYSPAKPEAISEGDSDEGKEQKAEGPLLFPEPPAPLAEHAWAESAGHTETFVSMEQQRMVPDAEPAQMRYIGAAFKTYLLFEVGERLLMIDQHAAHERVLYDRFMARYQGPKQSQRLLTPQMVRLTARDVGLLTEMEPELTEAGFEIDAFDATTVAVRAIPVILGQNEPIRELLLDMLDETLNHRGKVTHDRIRRRVAQLACKHAIKGGDALSVEDVKALIAQMLETNVQPTCPHGRPIVSEWTRRELEKRFKRIQ